ncbi:hypothetical protein ASG41_00505 [Modestobacter sp. Leaf380]|nr:hypothetical protein ASG41_00505 [Modestobacter sp. Leaf380]
MLPWTRTATLALLTLTAVLLTAGPASAHTGLSGTLPADGAVVTEAPTTVTLSFSAAVRGPGVTVTGPDGVGVGGEATVDGSVVTVPVTLTTGGTHTVDWAVTSGDGHRLEGATTFDWAPPVPLPVPSAVPGTTPPTTTAAPESTEEASTPAAAEPSDAAGTSPTEEGAGAGVVVAVLVVLLAAGVAVGAVLRRRRS